MTETLSLISVVVMALLLWREHRKRVKVEAAIIRDLIKDLNALQAEHLRWSDRDEKGRFVKRERGSSI